MRKLMLSAAFIACAFCTTAYAEEYTNLNVCRTTDGLVMLDCGHDNGKGDVTKARRSETPKPDVDPDPDTDPDGECEGNEAERSGR